MPLTIRITCWAVWDVRARQTEQARWRKTYNALYTRELDIVLEKRSFGGSSCAAIGNTKIIARFLHEYSSLINVRSILPRWNRLVAKLEWLLILGHESLQLNPWQTQVDMDYQTTPKMKITFKRRREKMKENLMRPQGGGEKFGKDMVRSVTINCKGNQNHSSWVNRKDKRRGRKTILPQVTFDSTLLSRCPDTNQGENG